MKPFPRQGLQRIGHVNQGTLGLGLDKSPRLGLRVLQLDAPVGAEDEREGAAVGVGVVAPVGSFAFRRIVEELEAGVVGFAVAMAILESTGVV